MTTTLSILSPAFNEEETILKVLDRVVAVPLPGGVWKEIVIVVDASTDRTKELVGGYIADRTRDTAAPSRRTAAAPSHFGPQGAEDIQNAPSVTDTPLEPPIQVMFKLGSTSTCST